MMESPFCKSCALAVLAAAVVAAAGTAFLYMDYRANAEAQREVLQGRADTLLDSLAAGLRAHGRMGRQRVGRIGLILEELAREQGVRGLWLATEDGSVVAAAGDGARPAEGRLPELRSNYEWQDSLLTASVVRELAGVGPGEPGQGRGRGMGMEFPDALEPGRYELRVALDAQPALAQVARQRFRFLAYTAVVWACCVFAATAYILQARQRRLRGALAEARIRAAEGERLAQVGAGLAHETKNPLGIVRGLAQAIASSPGAGEAAARDALRIVDEVDRTVGQINSFLSLARPKEAAPVSVDLAALVQELTGLLEAEAYQKGIRLASDVGHCRVEADLELLRRALLNLLVNALRACDSGGRVSVKAESGDSTVRLSVMDDGCGIAAEDLPHVKEPYFSRFSGGSGLGLALVDQIARAHGWTLRLESIKDEGTRAVLENMRRTG